MVSVPRGPATTMVWRARREGEVEFSLKAVGGDLQRPVLPLERQ